MNKQMTLISLALGVSLVFLASMGFAQVRWTPYEASWFIGHGVYSPTGTYLGQISDFVIDQNNDRIALVILSNVHGIGGMNLAVPCSSLIRTGNETFQFSFGDRPLEISTDSLVDQYTYNLEYPPMGSDVYRVPATIDPVWVETIYRHYGQAPYWTAYGEKPLASAELYRYSMLRDRAVASNDGQNVARVDDLVVGPSGHIEFVSLSGVAGKGDELVAVPFSLLSERGEGTFALDVSTETLASAPSFRHYFAINMDVGMAEGSYRYFGIQPAWGEPY